MGGGRSKSVWPHCHAAGLHVSPGMAHFAAKPPFVLTKQPERISKSKIFGSPDVCGLRTFRFTLTLNWRGVESLGLFGFVSADVGDISPVVSPRAEVSCPESGPP